MPLPVHDPLCNAPALRLSVLIVVLQVQNTHASFCFSSETNEPLIYESVTTYYGTIPPTIH